MKYLSGVDKSDLINKSADELKKIKELAPPSWSTHVRTGADKERPPVDRDWWYKRAASIMVKTASKGPIGVSKLRTEFGGKKRRGHQPAEFRRAWGSIIRKLMQQLESAGLVRQHEVGVHKGRVLTPAGTSLINKIAKQMQHGKPKRAPATGTDAGTKPAPKGKQGSDSQVRQPEGKQS